MTDREATPVQSETTTAETDDAREGPLWHPAYDAVGGGGVLLMGVFVGGSWRAGADALDVYFDVFGAFWLLAGLARWVWRARAGRPSA